MRSRGCSDEPPILAELRPDAIRSSGLQVADAAATTHDSAPSARTQTLLERRRRPRACATHASSWSVAELVAGEGDDIEYASPATALAVLAGIAASDAACCKALGRRSRATGSPRAATTLLEQVVPGGKQRCHAMIALLSLERTRPTMGCSTSAARTSRRRCASEQLSASSHRGATVPRPRTSRPHLVDAADDTGRVVNRAPAQLISHRSASPEEAARRSSRRSSASWRETAPPRRCDPPPARPTRLAARRVASLRAIPARARRSAIPLG